MPQIPLTMACAIAVLLSLLSSTAQAQFTHPGTLSTQTDLDRMATKVAEGAQPWKGSWDILVGNTNGYLDDSPNPTSTVYVDSYNGSDNYINLARECAKAYQCALRYHGSGDTAFADKAVEIMNAWAATHDDWDGNSNVQLRAGLYGYQFACAAELMRDYSGWSPSDFAAFQNYMLAMYYPINSDFLIRHNNTCNSHYWANWEHANMTSILAIGVLCDDQAIFDEALAYFIDGIGNGAIYKSAWYVHPNGLAQWQESGRDQGHSVMGPMLLGTFCEIAWNQGYDLYSYDNNRFLASVEYISKYNTWQDVPYRWYTSCDTWFSKDISSGSRGAGRPGWDLIYNHYVNRMGMAAPYTEDYAEIQRPEGGGFNYGGNSGGFDGLGFTTLTHSLDPITSGAVPSALRPTQQDWQVTLSWAGSAYAESYNVKRSTTNGGPYSTIATVGAKNLFYADAGLTGGTTYYYVVSANTPAGETADSDEASIIALAAGGDAYPAEDAAYGDGAQLQTWTTGHNGTGSVVPYSTGYIEWTGLDGGNGGLTTLEFRYALGDTARKGLMTLNGVTQELILPGTGDWDAWNQHYVTVTLNSGTNNTIRITSDGRDNYAYIDELIVKNSTAASPDSVPSAPGNVSATLNESKIDLSWSSVTGATSYNVKRATSSGGPYVVLDNVTAGTTTFSDTSLSYAATTYYYVVTALNSAGESTNSGADSIFLAPENLNATGGDGFVALDWDDSAPGSDLTGYNIYRSTTNGSGYAQIATGVSSNTYVDSTATNSTGYYYVVTAVNVSSAESGYSNEASAVPSEVYQENGGVLSMEAENGALGSRWLTGTDAGASNGAYLEVNPLYNWSDTSAPEGTTFEYLTVYNFNIATSGDYRFWFRMLSDNAVDDSFFWRIDDGSWIYENNRYGYGAWFSTDTSEVNNLAAGNHTLQIAYRENGTRLDKFVIQLDGLSDPSGNGPTESAEASDTFPPNAPTGLAATASDDGSVDLDWADNAESDWDSYTVYRSTTGGIGYSLIASGLGTSAYADGSVSTGTTYYYAVTATDTSSNESISSSEVDIVPQNTSAPAAPSGLVASAGNGVVDLDWTDNAEPDLDQYNLYRSTTAGSGYGIHAFGLTSSAFTDTAVTYGTTYYYVVTAVDIADNESAYSAEVSAESAGYNESGGIVSMEAENGHLGSRWLTSTDAGASSGTYLEVNSIYDYTGTTPPGTSDEYLVTYDFDISQGGNYAFWFRIYSDNGNDDSFFWRIDDGEWILENNRWGTGAWYATNHAQVDSLAAGRHTLQIAYRENGTRLDKFVIQQDGLTAPSGNGPAESALTPPPAISIVNSETVSGSGANSVTIPGFSLNDGNALVVLLASEGPDTTPSYSVTYGGVSITDNVINNEGYQSAAVYYAINGLGSSGDIVVTFDGSSTYSVAAVALSNVDSVADSASFASTAGTGSTSLSYNGVSKGMVFAALAENGWHGNQPSIAGDSIDTHLAQVAGTSSASAGRALAYGSTAVDTTDSATFTWGDTDSTRNAGALLSLVATGSN